MILKPESFAVIGASKEEGKVGNAVFNNLLNSGIKTYPVNPNAKEVLGRKCYANITELRNKVSHAVIAVPAKLVPEVMKECGIAKVKVAIIISSGFSEAGNNDLENEVLKIAKENNIRILGPNVLGIIVPGEFNASFFKGEIKKGSITFISQSGALGVAVLDEFISNNQGLRSFISAGNTADLTITDCLKEALQDKKTKCVMIYAESLKQGNEFMKACKNSKKPVIILKAGITSEGIKAASTHTGSMAGSDEIYNAALKQCGAIRVNSLKEMINKALIHEKHGKIGSKALIITNAGGPGILMTDSLISKGIKLPALPKKLINNLNKKLGNIAWSKNNPIDIIGDARAERYATVINEINKHNFYDHVIILLTPQAMTEPLKTAIEVMKIKKPCFPCFLGGDSVKEANELMKKKIIVINDINELSNALQLNSRINNN